MYRFLGKRFGLALVTLVLLSFIVFSTAQLLPGDIGRNVLGPFATPQSVRQLNHQLGVDRPFYAQYVTWVGHVLAGTSATRFSTRGRPSGACSGPHSSIRSSWRCSRSSSSCR
jgi:peptide/nickel transport system permease protein